MNDKILGYILLFIGIIIILFSGVSVARVFTKSVEPPQLLDLESNLELGLALPGALPGQTTQVPVQLDQLKPLLGLSNMVMYLVFMGFIASIGYKLSMIGTNLVRPIIVKAKQDPIIK